MHFLKSAILFTAAACGATCALAGSGEVTATMLPLSSTVTYSANASPGAPALTTYIGYTLSLANGSGNTINSVQFTVSISATDPAEAITLFTVPSGCSQSGSQFSCTVGQMKSGDVFPASGTPLVAFYKAPIKVDGNGVADTLGTDFVNANVRVVFAEGTNDQPHSQPQNSIRDWPAGPVALGTTNPVDVKSAVPKNGGTFFTGTGIPNGQNRVTELAVVPTLTSAAFGTAAIGITKVLDTGDAQCGNLAHFYECPTYTTTIPGGFPNSPWLTTIYRIDASNLKMSASKILNSSLLTYTDGTTSSPVLACVNSAPTGTGVPCILSSQCYKRSTPGWTAELDGDCEWTLINTKNGSLKIQ